MQKVDTTVEALVGMIERGELRLPEMQRRYVWRAPRVRDLLDSLYRGYPSGSILVWETDAEQPSRDLAVAQTANPFAKLLLDGQQRLTSLSAVVRGEPVVVRGRKKGIDILFNLDHPEQLEFAEVEGDEAEEEDDEDDDEEEDLQDRFRKRAFVVFSKQLAALPNWVSVTEVYKSADNQAFLKKAGLAGWDDPRFAKYSERLARLRAIRTYPYVMNVLPRTLGYEEVAEIFVRVNSLGAKLRGSDLALAQITARWRNSLKLLEDFQTECEDESISIDLGVLVRAMVVFATGQSRFGSVARIPIEKLKNGWEEAKNGLRFAMNFMRANAGIDDESLLSSPLFLITLAYIGRLRDEKFSKTEERDLLFWLHAANARGRYSRGSTETLHDEDLATLRNGGDAAALVATVQRQFGRLDFDAADFVGRGRRSPLFPLVFLALRAKGASDWRSGVKISLAHQGRAHTIQFHHIFAKSLIKGTYDKAEVNEIANLAFIAGKTNRVFSNKPPVDYIPGVVTERGADALTSQCVPTDVSLHELDKFRDFLGARRVLLAEAVNTFLARARDGEK